MANSVADSNEVMSSSTITRVTKCPICLEDFARMKRIVLTLECSHVFCRKCLRSYVLDQLANGPDVRCPHPDCTSLLDLKGSLKGLVSQKLIKEAQKKTIFNKCPVARCTGSLKDGQCDKCHVKLCFHCGEIEHSGKECNSNIKLSYQQILQDSKSCPNCHVKIFKDGGCDHVHCKKCNKDFDWRTMRPWEIVIQEIVALAEQDIALAEQDIENIHPLDIVNNFPLNTVGNQVPRVVFMHHAVEIRQRQNEFIDREITEMDQLLIGIDSETPVRS